MTALGLYRRIAAIGLGTFVLAFVTMSALRLRINTSPSLPIGLYQVTGGATDLVEFCPSEPAASLATERGYRQAGSCPDGATPLLKPVVARAGDIVSITVAGIEVNGRSLPNTAPVSADTRGRPLAHWPCGRYFVKPGELWVSSTYHARSFDSRYFGPIHGSMVRSWVRPLFVFR